MHRLTYLLILAVLLTACSGPEDTDFAKHLQAGMMAQSQELFDDAIAEYDQALSIAPEMASGYVTRGTAYDLRALQSQKLIIELKDVEAANRQELIDAVVADSTAALKDFEKAVELDEGIGAGLALQMDHLRDRIENPDPGDSGGH